jgi:hypothetical protein
LLRILVLIVVEGAEHQDHRDLDLQPSEGEAPFDGI